MKIYVQWATAVNRDWTQTEDTLWQNTGFKADPSEPRDATGYPTGDALLNNSAGWIFDLNVQGVSFGTVDHMHVTNENGVCVVTVWNDDPYWYPAGRKEARVWRFPPITPENPEPAQTWTFYADTDRYAEEAAREQLPQGMTLARWQDFVPPNDNRVRHGIWVSDQKWSDLVTRQTLRGFREWI